MEKNDRDAMIAVTAKRLLKYIFLERVEYLRDYREATLNNEPLLSPDRWFPVAELKEQIEQLGGAPSWWSEVRKAMQEELAISDTWKERGRQYVWFSGPWSRGYKITHDPKEAYRMVAFLTKIAEGFGLSVEGQIKNARDYGEIKQLMDSLDEAEVDIDSITSPMVDLDDKTVKLLAAKAGE